MKLLFDENLAPRLAEALADLFPESAHVHELGLGSAEDSTLWVFAKTHGFAIVTKDADFAERSVLDPAPPKVLWLRTGNCTTGQVERLLRLQVEVIHRFLSEDSETCLVLV